MATTADLKETFSTVRSLLKRYQPPLVATVNRATRYELWSQREVIIAGRKRTEVFFASVIVQKEFVGFYFMPVYADTKLKAVFKPELLQRLKGKSCFHLKVLDRELTSQIRSALAVGFAAYKKRGWV
ncbi:MAG: DUF1801 domain-containing protein [Chloroflexi bacterium]|nr:DUF1801 domain-containing protein [Chloroflexota bacterium]